MTSLVDIQTELQGNIKFQATPIPMTNDDYASFTLQGVKRLYVDEGIEDNFLTDYDKTANTLLRDLTLTEQEYAWTCAEIAFRSQIKDDLAELVGYTTDALSVSNATQPYKNSQTVITTLENRLSVIAFKFAHSRYTL